MTDEEKKAIERLTNYKEKIKDELYPIIDFEEEKAIGMVLNLIEKQEKVIDEITIYINNNIDVISKDIEGSICCHNKDGKCINRKCVECVKQYFYRKVENNE